LNHGYGKAAKENVKIYGMTPSGFQIRQAAKKEDHKGNDMTPLSVSSVTSNIYEEKVMI
jgi:hypothetical protein